MEFDGRISQVYFFDAIRSGLIEMIELSYICVAALFFVVHMTKGSGDFMRSPMRNRVVS